MIKRAPPVQSQELSLNVLPPKRASPDTSLQVYVGHICTRIEDQTIRELLELCGPVTNWIRQPDPNTGKWIHFGYCEFQNLESVWRALELLDGQQLGSRVLVVKCEARISRKVDDFLTMYRPDAEKQRRIKATINSLITATNQKWKDSCLRTDAVSKPRPPTSHTTEVSEDSFLQYLSKRYRISSREQKRITKRKRCAEEYIEKFNRKLSQWEREEEKIFEERARQEKRDSEYALECIHIAEIDGENPHSVFDFVPSFDAEAENREDEEDRNVELIELAEFESQERVLEKKRNEFELLRAQKSERLRVELAETTQEQSKHIKELGLERNNQNLPRLLSNISANRELELTRLTVEKIPRSLDELVMFQLSSDVTQSSDTLEGKLRPWLRLKFIEQFSDDRDSLVAFIVSSVKSQATLPAVLEQTRSLPQGKDYDSIIVRMWQLLVFESLAVK